MVSLPTYDDNLFARGISRQGVQQAREQSPIGRSQPRRQRAVPAWLDVQARDRHRRARRTARSPTTERVVDHAIPDLGRGYRYWDWNRRGWGPLNIYDGFGHSSDTFFYQLAGRLGIDRLAYWAKQFGFGERTGIDLPAEARGTVPVERLERRGLRPADLPRRDLPGRHRPGLRHGDAASSC